MNQFTMSGYAAADAEVRRAANGAEVVKLRVAVNNKVRDKNTGELVDKPEFHNVEVWGVYAVAKAKTIVKGDYVVVQGKMSPITCSAGKDGKLYVNYTIRVTDSDLWSYLNYSRKPETVVNGG